MPRGGGDAEGAGGGGKSDGVEWRSGTGVREAWREEQGWVVAYWD